MWYIIVEQEVTTTTFLNEGGKVKKKKERFRLEGEEKDQRLDVRMTTALRNRLESYCTGKSKRLTEVITTALEEFLNKNEGK
jgi:hypothetical protein